MSAYKWGPSFATPGEAGWRLKTNAGHETGFEWPPWAGLSLPDLEGEWEPLPVESWS